MADIGKISQVKIHYADGTVSTENIPIGSSAKYITIGENGEKNLQDVIGGPIDNTSIYQHINGLSDRITQEVANRDAAIGLINDRFENDVLKIENGGTGAVGQTEQELKASARENLGLGDAAVYDTIPIANGGTGASNAAAARTNLELGSIATQDVVPINKGGTNATDEVTARENLGLGNAAIYDIVPIVNGGTGANNVADAIINLGVAAATDLDSIEDRFEDIIPEGSEGAIKVLQIEHGGTGAYNAATARISLGAASQDDLNETNDRLRTLYALQLQDISTSGRDFDYNFLNINDENSKLADFFVVTSNSQSSNNIWEGWQNVPDELLNVATASGLREVFQLDTSGTRFCVKITEMYPVTGRTFINYTKDGVDWYGWKVVRPTNNNEIIFIEGQNNSISCNKSYTEINDIFDSINQPMAIAYIKVNTIYIAASANKQVDESFNFTFFTEDKKRKIVTVSANNILFNDEVLNYLPVISQQDNGKIVKVIGDQYALVSDNDTILNVFVNQQATGEWYTQTSFDNINQYNGIVHVQVKFNNELTILLSHKETIGSNTITFSGYLRTNRSLTSITGTTNVKNYFITVTFTKNSSAITNVTVTSEDITINDIPPTNTTDQVGKMISPKTLVRTINSLASKPQFQKVTDWTQVETWNYSTVYLYQPEGETNADWYIWDETSQADPPVELIMEGVDIPIMNGATSSTDGKEGLVPKPTANNYNKYLKGDGTWSSVDATTIRGYTVEANVPSDAVFTDTTYSDVTQSQRGLMTAADKTKLDNLVQTAVKGNAQSTYRQGNVNLTYANLGVAPVTQGGTGATTLDGAGILTKSKAQIATGSKYFPIGTGIYHNGDSYLSFFNSADAGTNNLLARFLIGTGTTNSVKRTNRIYLMQYSYNSSTGVPNGIVEGYQLPVVSADLTSNTYYNILTSKSPVTIAQGGTGASDAATARTNLGITKANIGLGNVENKSSATIRGELTKANVTDALGYTPPTTNTTYSNATTSAAGLCPKLGGGTTNFLRADGTWATPPGTYSLTSAKVTSALGYTPARIISVALTINSSKTQTFNNANFKGTILVGGVINGSDTLFGNPHITLVQHDNYVSSTSTTGKITITKDGAGSYGNAPITFYLLKTGA